MEVIRVEGVHLEQVLDDTYPLWHDGLSRARYGDYNAAQLKTTWGARHLERVALVEDDHVLASAKRYRLTVSLDGIEMAAVGIGAVFTPPGRRGRGYARLLLERIMDAAAAEGAGAALLFSEIGADYYARLGFVPVPLLDANLTVQRRAGAPAVPVRAVEPGDLPHLVDLHRAMARGYRFSLAWDSEWLAYSLAKKRMLAAFSPEAGRAVECFVAEEGGRAVAWVLVQVSGRDRPGYREGWSVEACGDRDPSGARVGAILQALLARQPAGSPPMIRAWWPPRLQPPQVILHPHATSPILMMMRPLAAGIDPASLVARDVLYWHGDAF
jgi:GNAT superfamily N-acetyltransferase